MLNLGSLNRSQICEKMMSPVFVVRHENWVGKISMTGNLDRISNPLIWQKKEDFFAFYIIFVKHRNWNLAFISLNFKYFYKQQTISLYYTIHTLRYKSNDNQLLTVKELIIFLLPDLFVFMRKLAVQYQSLTTVDTQQCV